MAANSPGNADGSWNRGQSSWNVGFLHTYPLTMFLGVVVSFLTVVYFWKRQKYSWEILQVILILIVPGGIFGARLWFLISEGGWSQWYILSGLSIQGGIMGALICLSPFLYLRRHAVDARTVIGIIMPSIIIGQAIGRWGNFDNHEVYGKIVSKESLDWMGAMQKHMFIEGHYRAPLFFYEFLTSTIGYLLIVWVLLRKNWVKPGVTATIYLIWYGLVRTSMEPLRDPVDIMKIGALPTSLFISVSMLVIGIVLTVYFQFFSKKKYDLIQPIKERKLFFFGEMSSKKKKYVFFGEELPNKVRIWLPNNEGDKKWSKREINKGARK